MTMSLNLNAAEVNLAWLLLHSSQPCWRSSIKGVKTVLPRLVCLTTPPLADVHSPLRTTPNVPSPRRSKSCSSDSLIRQVSEAPDSLLAVAPCGRVCCASASPRFTGNTWRQRRKQPEFDEMATISLADLLFKLRRDILVAVCGTAPCSSRICVYKALFSS